MKNRYRNIWLMAAVLMVLVFANQAVHATLTDELRQLKSRYDELCEQYKQAIADSKADIASKLSYEVQKAKNAYDKAREALTISDNNKKSIAETVDTVTTTTKEVFSNGEGSNAEGAATGSGTTLSGFDNMKISIEGNNYCGQYAMTAVFNSLGIQKKTAQEIYEDTNPSGIFTAPSTIVEYLNLNGVDAYEKYDASVSDIIERLDAGKPVMVLMSTESGTPHWVTICGYEVNENGEVSGIKMRDSYWGTSSCYTMNIATFKERWSSPCGDGLLGNLAGYSNMMIDIKGTKTADSSPSAFNFNFNTATEDCIAGGINDVVTGFKNFELASLGGGVVKCVLGIPGAVVGIAGNGVTSAGKSMVEWGKEEFSEDGVGSKIAGGLSVVGGYAAQAVGWAAEKVGNAASSVANVAGNLVKKLGYVFR